MSRFRMRSDRSSRHSFIPARYPNADSFVAELLRIEASVLEGVRSGEPLPSDIHASRRLELLLDEALAAEAAGDQAETEVTTAVFDEMEREAQDLAQSRRNASPR